MKKGGNMDFEYWTDGKGVEHKPSEMSTRHIKIVIGVLKWQLKYKSPFVPALSENWNTWLKIFTKELERRENNE